MTGLRTSALNPIARTRPRFRFDIWTAGAVVIAFTVALPVLTVLGLAFFPTENIWPHLWDTVLPGYILTTLELLAGAAIGTRPDPPAGSARNAIGTHTELARNLSGFARDLFGGPRCAVFRRSLGIQLEFTRNFPTHSFGTRWALGLRGGRTGPEQCRNLGQAR